MSQHPPVLVVVRPPIGALRRTGVSTSGPVRLLVTGSRGWQDWSIVVDELWRLPDGSTVVEGEARGLDRIARIVAEESGYKVDPFPADWKRYKKRAGYVRNAEMVEAGANFCVAFILNGSPGATMCADLAERAGIPTKRIEMTDPWLPFTPITKDALAYLQRAWEELDLPEVDLGHWSLEYAREIYELVGTLHKAEVDRDTMIDTLFAEDVWDEDQTKQQWVPNER